MLWHWKVRIYRGDSYAVGQLTTERNLRVIDTIQDFYFAMTGYKMLLEGMSEAEFHSTNDINTAFSILWEK